MAKAELTFKNGEVHEFESSIELMNVAYTFGLLLNEEVDTDGGSTEIIKDVKMCTDLIEAADNMKEMEDLEDKFNTLQLISAPAEA